MRQAIYKCRQAEPPAPPPQARRLQNGGTGAFACLTASIAILILTEAFAGAQGFIADSARGRQLFTTLSCVQCHSVNGAGGSLGPDLGKIVDRGFTPAMLA